jgi:glycosyltransferase involved in cell wall biosynthesis
VTPSLRIALVLDPMSVTLDGPLSLRVRWGNHAPPLARELLGRGHTVRGFGAPPGLIPRSSEVAFERAKAPGFWSKLRAFEPEVLLAYEARSPAAVRGARMARKLGSTLVLVDSALPEKGRPILRALTRVGETLWGPYVRHTAGGFIALDEPTRLEALRLGYAPDLVRVVRPGVDTGVYRPGLSSTLVSRHRIRGRILLYIGRMSEDRGVADLINAFARTVGQRADWNLVLAGDGPALPALRLMVERLGVGDRVHWLLRPREEELPGLYSAATLLAIPACGEGASGRQIPRALATGLPILVSDLPRFSGWVRHEEEGLLVRPGDVEAWTAALRHAAGSPQARQRWSANGRRNAVEHFDWRAVAAEFELAMFAARERVQAKLALRDRSAVERLS